MNALELHQISKRFGREQVLDEVSFSVPTGSTLVLFGPSGAGKTVLLRLIAGVIAPDSGELLIDGRDVASVEPERRGVGMAFQNFALFPHRSAFDNIASPLQAQRAGVERVRMGVESVAKLLKIEHVLSHMPRALSNGQKQRTALARALAAEPKLLLLDDPLRNVDAKLRFEMRLELPRLLSGRGASVVYVTQDYKEAMALGDQIAVLAQGRLVQLGTPEDIYLRPADLNTAALFGDPSINRLQVTPERDEQGVFVRLSQRRLPLGSGAEVAVGRDCVLGLRPEMLHFVALESQQAASAIPVTIEAETPLNEKIVTLVVTAGGRELLVSRPAGDSASGFGSGGFDVGDTVLVAPSSVAAALLFDDNGARIDFNADAVVS